MEPCLTWSSEKKNGHSDWNKAGKMRSEGTVARTQSFQTVFLLKWEASGIEWYFRMLCCYSREKVGG